MLDNKVKMMLLLITNIVLCNKELRCSPPVTHPRNGGFDVDADADAREDDVDAHSDHSDAVQ